MLNFKEWLKTEWGFGNSFDKDGNIVSPTFSPAQRKTGIKPPVNKVKSRPSFELNRLEQEPPAPTEVFNKDTHIMQKIDNLEMRISRLEKRT